MTINKSCDCSECLSNKYNQEDYIANLNDLNIENRPNGVSGYARVYNDARTLELSIKSVVDSLDELMIVVQPCTDSSLEIALKLEQEYPNKIKVFNYKPRVDFNNGKEPLDNPFSVHSLVNYYNFVLSKCTYATAVKIDTDQIYIQKKMQFICDSYRNKKYQLNLFNFIFCKNYRIKYRLFYKFNKLIRKNKDRTDTCFEVGGLETFLHNNEISLFKEQNNFHGLITDHKFHKMHKDLYYKQSTSHIFEIYSYDYPYRFNLGLLWIHCRQFKPEKKIYRSLSENHDDNRLLNFTKLPYTPLPLNEFLDTEPFKYQLKTKKTHNQWALKGLNAWWKVDKELLKHITLPNTPN